MKHVVIATLSLSLVGCQEVKPPSAPSPKPSAVPAPRASGRPSPASPQPAPAAVTDPATLTRTWSVQTAPFLRGLEVTANHVLVQSRDSLTLLDRRAGKVIASREVCETGLASVAVRSGEAWLMCPDALQAYSLPKLTPADRHPLPSPGRRVAFGVRRALVASDDGVVRDIDLAEGSVTRSFAVGGAPEAIAVGPKGRFAAGRAEGDVVVYAPDGTAARIGAPVGFAVEALSYAPDRRHLAVSAGPSLAVWRLGKEAPERLRFSGLRQVVDAQWLGDHHLATVGPDGVLVLDVRTQAVAALSGDPGGEELLAVAGHDRGAVCVGDRNGRVTCWGKGRPRNVAPTDPSPGARCAGTIASFEGRALAVVAEPGAPLPEVGTKVALRRFARTTAKNRQTAVWLEVARARVSKVEGAQISLQLIGPVGFAPVVGPVLGKGVVVELRWQP